MSPYNVQGWIWSSTGVPVTLLPVTITDDDPDLSPYFTNDLTETITIAGTTYTNPSAGTYELTFTDSGSTSHTEDFLLWSTGSNFIFVPLPGSSFDTGSTVTSLGGWQDWTSGFTWTDVTCFTTGALILAGEKSIPVETIKVGDLIQTSSGFSAVRWIGKRQVHAKELKRNPKLRPIRITAGAMGNGLPERDLVVSRQHRMLIQSKIAQRMFGTSEVLIPAIKLIDCPGIFIDETVESVEYYHLLFDRHEVIFAEGAATESFFTAPEAFKSLSEDALEEIRALFPEIVHTNHSATSAKFIPKGKTQKQLIARHLKNNRILVDAALSI